MILIAEKWLNIQATPNINIPFFFKSEQEISSLKALEFQ